MKEQRTLNIPQCAHKQYWFITEEWNEYVETSPIATVANPNPQQMQSVVHRKQNQIIAMHPVVHAVFQQGNLSEYCITMALLVKKDLYEWVVNLNQQAEEMKAAAENGNLENELRSEIANNLQTPQDSGADSGILLS